MTVNRRDLLVKGGATAGLAAAAAASANPVLAQAQTQTTPSNWDREADVVVIGAGATGLPAAIVAREAGASVILVEAAAAYRRPRDHAAAATCRSAAAPAAEEIRHRGFCRPVVPRPDRLVGGRAQRLSRLSLQRPRDHPRLRRQQRRRPSNGCWRMASCLSTRRRTTSAATRSATRCRARCIARSATGRWCRPASPPTRRSAQTRSSGNGLMRPLEAAAQKCRRRDPARAPDDRDPPRGADVGPRARHRGRPQRRDARTSARARPSSSAPAARPATSISAACSTRA